jgi:hypothetical protein
MDGKIQIFPWTALAQPPPQGFLERCWEIRWAVPTPTPNSLEIARQDAPEARRVSNRFWLTNMGGRPSRFPFARALRNPALTRSTIKLRSSSATAPRTVKTILPVGVPVSTLSESETKSTPSAPGTAQVLGASATRNGQSDRSARRRSRRSFAARRPPPASQPPWTSTRSLFLRGSGAQWNR